MERIPLPFVPWRLEGPAPPCRPFVASEFAPPAGCRYRRDTSGPCDGEPGGFSGPSRQRARPCNRHRPLYQSAGGEPSGEFIASRAMKDLFPTPDLREIVIEDVDAAAMIATDDHLRTVVE